MTPALDLAIEVRDVTIAYGGMVAVDRVSFEVRKGEFVCLLGPSGCGKSTLLNAIAGFERPSWGEVLVDGAEVAGPGPDRGVVFQQPHLFPWKSVRANVAHGPRMMGASRAEARATADRLIDIVGLTRFAGALPHTLSGGMQQRVAIARALAGEPGILLMDEPFGALDAQTRALMQENLLRVRARVGATIVFVTHDIEEAILLADRVLVMSAGPGRILRDIKVELPRPRSVEQSLEPDFVALRRECLELIRQQSAKAFEAA
ncbi:ABC transporter ATP-binding protein [Hansschlegelia zhihuaiae]|uniref:ABC transporter ATP-binding protein n=1 Tax=Hansschlegelia zhihuaiae TaxID=405005 RepID=A0A4Q0MNK9_9HYPH|nr:ABC transporter ATP-binding protein [Hansschlegelia zhihuaiae]RXF75398.1 ABC transporter ATP-binding protein [Hansschlegelia zhihuaiae]